MLSKIKKVLCITGAFITVLFCTISIFMLRRSKTDRRAGNSSDERDSRIQEGFDSSQERADRIEEGITRAEDGIARCERRLQRAEDILRETINRSKEERKK